MIDKETAANFHFQEMVALKTEIADLGKEARTYETLTFAGTFTLYAWLLLNDAGAIERCAWWLPVPFILMAFLRVLACFARIGLIGRYLRDLEIKYALPNVKGWHHHLDSKKGYRQIRNPIAFLIIHALGISLGIYWAGISLIVAFAIYHFALPLMP